MTTDEMITQVREMADAHMDLYQGETLTNAQVVSLLNWAQKVLGRAAKLFSAEITITLVAGTQSYDLRTACSKRVTQPVGAVINAVPLNDYMGERPGLWSFAELEAEYSTWRSAANGTPTVAAVLGTKIFYYLKPSSAVVVAGSNFVPGYFLPADLSASSLSAVSDLPEELHEGLCELALIKGAMPHTREQEALAQLAAINQSATELVGDIAATTVAMVQAGWAVRA